MVTVEQIFLRVSYLLQDATVTKYTAQERLLWLNDGRRAIAAHDPSHFGGSVEHRHFLTRGCRQRINADTAPNIIKVASVDYNHTSGRAIRLTTKEQLDAFKPTWRKDTSVDVQNWFPEELDRLAFWVYPATSAQLVDYGSDPYIGDPITTHSVMLRVFQFPSSIGDGDTALPNEKYLSALVNYICFRALSKNSELGNAEGAAAYKQLFEAELGAV